MSSRFTSLIKNNAVAVVALFVAMGGTSYAAIKLPAGSVGSKQIKKSAVTYSKLSASARAALEGRQGAKGDPGVAGAPGAKGDKGDIGPSTAFAAGENGTLTWTGAQQTVVSLPLPAGSYALTAKVMANNNAGATASVNCRLDLDSAVDVPASGLTLGPTGLTGERGYFVLTGVATTVAPAVAIVRCTAPNASGNWLNRRITAIQVGAIG